MPRNLLETLLGAVVVVVAVGFLAYAYLNGGPGDGAGGMTLTARFESIDGLNVGSDVRISGIKVGEVVSETLDPESYMADVRFTVASNIALPSDSSAAISSASLLGGKYLSLTPGGDTQMLEEGGEITLTQPSLNIERLIGQYAFGVGGGGGASGGAPGGGQGGAPAAGGQGGAANPFSTGLGDGGGAPAPTR